MSRLSHVRISNRRCHAVGALLLLALTAAAACAPKTAPAPVPASPPTPEAAAPAAEPAPLTGHITRQDLRAYAPWAVLWEQPYVQIGRAHV